VLHWSGIEHLIDVLLFEVVGDVLHNCLKAKSAMMVIILARVLVSYRVSRSNFQVFGSAQQISHSVAKLK
jgi:hypothetical protein